MVTMINYLKARYMSEKAQGIVEYALLLAFVVAIAAVALTSDSGLGAAVSNVFSKTASQVNK